MPFERYPQSKSSASQMFLGFIYLFPFKTAGRIVGSRFGCGFCKLLRNLSPEGNKLFPGYDVRNFLARCSGTMLNVSN